MSITRLLEGDPDYEEMKAELEPFITNITKIKGKYTPEYLRFKENLFEWNERFYKAARTAGTVESIQTLLIPLMNQLQSKPENRRLFAVVNLFRYLGRVESMGVQLLDMLVLLLIANGREFHVEQIHDLPRIVHAKNFDDLKDASIRAKIAFLKRNGLKKTAGFIDTDLRNDIAHLDFSVDKKGKISTKHYKNLNINERINTFARKFAMIHLILSKEGFEKILSRKKVGG